MHPSTGNWGDFLYTVASWLLPRPDRPELLRVFQPVPTRANDDWAADIGGAIAWLRSGQRKRVRLGATDTPTQG